MYLGFSFVLGLSSFSWLCMPSQVLLVTMLGHHPKSHAHFADHLIVQAVPLSHQPHQQAYPSRLSLREFHLVSVFLQVYKVYKITS